MAMTIYKLVRRQSTHQWHGGDIGYIRTSAPDSVVDLFKTHEDAKKYLDELMEAEYSRAMRIAKAKTKEAIDNLRKEYHVEEVDIIGT